MAALGLLLAGCAGNDAPAPQAGDKPTIVSLNPCTDAILAEVAAPGQLLAISHYSKDARSSSMATHDAARFASTGGTVEEVLALQPDVVVASTFLSPATMAAMADLGLDVRTFGAASTVEESIAQVRELAALAGREDAGERLVAQIQQALEDAASAGEPVEGALWQPGGIVPGEASLVSDLMRRTGFKSYAATRGMAQADYLSLEQVMADPPQVLLVAGTEAGQTHPVLDTVTEMRRETFDTRLLYCGGPTIIEAARRLAEIREGSA
ncbi:ABC transporter substrate-binding protein [Qipengyuania sp. 1XM1-15A]|nr:ABC transporter substrate-binding protein [Qipengyuania xiamenensis]MBX7531829.1 ABC transporter substrate-binding protein [Qipengyuania xiamenensis]